MEHDDSWCAVSVSDHSLKMRSRACSRCQAACISFTIVDVYDLAECGKYKLRGRLVKECGALESRNRWGARANIGEYHGPPVRIASLY